MKKLIYCFSFLRKSMAVWTLAACSVVRASVSDWRTFPDMRLIYGWRVATSWIRRPLWVNQPGQLSLLPSVGRGMSSISVAIWVKLLAAVPPSSECRLLWSETGTRASTILHHLDFYLSGVSFVRNQGRNMGRWSLSGELWIVHLNLLTKMTQNFLTHSFVNCRNHNYICINHFSKMTVSATYWSQVLGSTLGSTVVDNRRLEIRK